MEVNLGSTWINLDQQSIIRLSHVWNCHIKGMILKPVSKLVVECNGKCVLYLRGSCNLNLHLESITKVRIFEEHVEVWKECDKFLDWLDHLEKYFIFRNP